MLLEGNKTLNMSFRFDAAVPRRNQKDCNTRQAHNQVTGVPTRQKLVSLRGEY